MTLDEAIDHAHEVACGCGKCADEHRQLAEWLEELKELREGNATTNYEKLFGTPERAALTLVYVLGCKDSRPWVSCEECPILDGCKTRSGGYDALLEWLRGDAE